eukprot:GSChrysophyteH1.ASY1.ANO1.535.1 assembled CDS
MEDLVFRFLVLSSLFMSSFSRLLPVLGVRSAEITYPTGSKSFAVLQGFPAAFSAEEADPFLMCDEFGPTVSPGVVTDHDEFPIGWHPHRGQDLLTYMIKGIGRHGDSMGNRETFSSPGMQWINAGSGIEHAEAGGTPAGEEMHGFQIWVNVPSHLKMEDPAYGTHSESEIPLYVAKDGQVKVRVLAGSFETEDFSDTGPFQTQVAVQMLDVTVQPGAKFEYNLPSLYDNLLVYCYGKGGQGGMINGEPIQGGSIARLDASSDARSLSLSASQSEVTCLVFAGKKLNQKIAWHGPFVMTTDDEIRQTLMEYRSGIFLKKSAPWDYRRISSAPAGTYTNGVNSVKSDSKSSGEL